MCFSFAFAVCSIFYSFIFLSHVGHNDCHSTPLLAQDLLLSVDVAQTPMSMTRRAIDAEEIGRAHV